MNNERKKILFDIDHTLFNTDEFRLYLPPDMTTWYVKPLPFARFVYPEVFSVLQTLKNTFRLGIFSRSEIDAYQRAKLFESGLAEFFEPELVFIGQDVDVLLGDMKQTVASIHYAVDDLPDKLSAIKLVYPAICTVRVRRGKYANDPFTFQPDYEIADLNGLYTIVT